MEILGILPKWCFLLQITVGDEWTKDRRNEGERRSVTWESFLFLSPFLFLVLFFLCQTRKDLNSGPELPRPEGQGKPLSLEAVILARVHIPPSSSLGTLCKQNSPVFLFSGKSFCSLLLIWEYELWGIAFAAVCFLFLRDRDLTCSHKPLPSTWKPQLTKMMSLDEGQHTFPGAGPYSPSTVASSSYPSPPLSPSCFVVTCLPLTVSYNLPGRVTQWLRASLLRRE